MINILIAFVTGLTTGGLSCLAVQGGLLAGSMAHQIEQDLQQPKTSKSHPALARPILLFLGAKLIAYTILGALLGILGSMLHLTPVTRAILHIAIGIFMVGSALRMANVHPIFRYFAFEPPAGVTRYLRRVAKGDASDVTALFLGTLTVLIPCGVTQAMMAVAMGTGSPLEGATIMAAFTLGTSPLFFTVSYFAGRLGTRLEAYFMRAVAAVLLLLGLVSIESGLNLMGSPLSLARLLRPQSTAATAPIAATTPTALPETTAPAAPNAPQVLVLEAKNYGYEPSVLHAPADVPLRLDLITIETRSCSRAFVIPALNVQEILPATGRVSVDLPPQPKGTVMQFSCSMGMYTGEIVFE